MLFLATLPYEMTMWMKDTYIPLDMLFFDEGGRIVYIHTASPLDLTAISAGRPVLGVIELKGGTVRKLGIRLNDKVTGF